MTPKTNPHPGLYIHIPFCRSRCAYCTFTSGKYSEDLANKYIAALHTELQTRTTFSPKYQPSTLFIGGGTPSILTPTQLDTLLSTLPTAQTEATCEVNPDSITREKLRILRKYGINRLSFGVQTFSTQGLHTLGRTHNAITAQNAIETALDEGFENISLDLINSWPGQDEKVIENDLNISLNLQIHHLSYYSMILDPSCRGYEELSSRMADYPDSDEREGRFWDFIEEYLENKGFKHYETSNFSLPGHECLHNVQIWKGGEYLGIGTAAHSYIGGRRFANTSDVEKYVKCSNNMQEIEDYSEKICGVEKARECAVFWLRLFEGIDVGEFSERTGYSLEEVYGEELDRLTGLGYLEWGEGGRFLRVPRRYQPVLDSILVELI